jgi:hypothetical protein
MVGPAGAHVVVGNCLETCLDASREKVSRRGRGVSRRSRGISRPQSWNLETVPRLIVDSGDFSRETLETRDGNLEVPRLQSRESVRQKLTVDRTCSQKHMHVHNNKPLSACNLLTLRVSLECP